MENDTEVFKPREPQLDKKKPNLSLGKFRAICLVGLLYIRMILGTALVFLRILFKSGNQSKKGGERR